MDISKDINKYNNHENIIKCLNDKTNQNKVKFNIEKYLNLEYEVFKYFYLINEKWINSKMIGNNDYISFKPDIIKTEFNYEYPINFKFIEEHDSGLIVELKKYENINEMDLYKTKMFFVYNDNFLKKKLYFGILASDRNVIYFYSFEKESYNVEFIIHYDNVDFLFYEIKDHILLKGIEAYLYELGICYNQGERQYLYNYKLEKIGLIFFLNDDKKYNYPLYHSNILENIKDSHYYNGVIQCLANITQLKHIFLNRNKLIDQKIVNKKTVDKKIITYNFYKFIQYMWYNNTYNKNFDDNNSNQAIIFLIEIQRVSGDNKLLSNIKNLIGFLLLSMHCEQKINENNDHKIKYSLKELEKTCYKDKNTFISDLFFFELEKNKCCKNSCSTNYVLFYEIDDFLKKINNGQAINIYTILNQTNMEIVCDNCKKECKSYIKFISFPKILFIILLSKKDKDIKFYYNQKLDISKYASEKIKIANSYYNLVGAIKKYEKGFITFCKTSGDNNCWYKYIETETVQKMQIYNSFDCIKENKDMPYLLIYQQYNE